MALDNLISVSYTDEELQQLDDAMTVIEKIMNGKAVSLTPKQRQQYGRVAYDMEVWVNKAHGYMQQLPQLVPAYIDRAEHEADLQAHRTLNPRIDRLNAIMQSMQDTNLLLGTDIYNNSLSFYRSVREAAKGNAVGAVPAYNDLKRQFPGGGRQKAKRGITGKGIERTDHPVRKGAVSIPKVLADPFVNTCEVFREYIATSSKILSGYFRNTLQPLRKYFRGISGIHRFPF